VAGVEVMGKFNGYNNNLAPFYVFVAGAEIKILYIYFTKRNLLLKKKKL